MRDVGRSASTDVLSGTSSLVGAPDEVVGTHRLAVVRDEKFVGMITIDDLLVNLAAELADLSRPITGEILFAHHDSQVPGTR